MESTLDGRAKRWTQHNRRRRRELVEATLRAIRKHYPGLHCVVLSGFPTADNIRALREFDNVVRFVTKPWAQDVLLATLREAVDRGQNRPG